VQDAEGVAIGENASVSITKVYPESPQKRPDNQHKLIKIVQDSWIGGLLNNSLQKQVIIRLGLEDDPGKVNNRLRSMTTQDGKAEPQLLPEGTTLLNLFDQQNDRLLILGAPGSGKTTALLELTRDLLTRAEADPTKPVPVVVNLSSWAKERKPIAEWLIDEIDNLYLVSQKLSAQWIEADALIYLLDGLDEVDETHRDECVDAINAFCQEYEAPVVVCSRITDYATLETNLTLRQAVVLQPLDSGQITDYFADLGSDYQAVAQAIQTDGALQELAETPLMLSIITLALEDAQPDEIDELEQSDSLHKTLYNRYVKQMFKHRNKHKTEQELHPYTQQQTLTWLAWLARRMQAENRSVFLLEQIQPNWLRPNAILLYRILMVLIFGLSVGLSGGLIVGALIYGLDAFIQHFVLRLFLRIGGHAPLNYVAFLDYAAEILLLRKVSGSYLFVHRTLLEYFADLTDAEIATPKNVGACFHTAQDSTIPSHRHRTTSSSILNLIGIANGHARLVRYGNRSHRRLWIKLVKLPMVIVALG